ncbi:MAG TPA: hypothetical protein VFE05_16785 [Longimicrobiaceae bacterium]|jgi:hypothetical protein|nr:hypothetical protein [Longimicrobiaceae bacterium]
MHTVRVSPWTPVFVLAAIVASVFLTLGYGIIGLAFVFVLVSVGGGALMSMIGGD